MALPINLLIDGDEGKVSRRRRRVKEVRGSTGTKHQNGRLLEEYLFELQGLNGVDRYDEMWRSDAMIRALWLTTVLLVQAAEKTVNRYGVDPESSPKREIRKADEIKDFWDTALFGTHSKRPFKEMLYETMTQLIYGFVIQEWEVFYDPKAEVLWLRDLYLRHPRSIYAASEPWVFDGDDLEGVHQRDIYSNNGLGPSDDVFLPRDSILLGTNEQVGSNYEGISWLRSCWRPYFAKKVLIQIALIGAERMAVGFPVAQMGPTFSRRRLRELIQLVTNIRIGADNGAVLSAEESLNILEGKLDMDKLMTKIEYCDLEMARAWRNEFIMLGQSNTKGGYSLSSDKTDLYMVSEYSLCDTLADKLRRDVFYPITVMNFGEENAQQFTPTLSFDIQRENAAQLADIWFKLATGDNPVLTEGPHDEDWLRSRFHFPQRELPRPPRMSFTSRVKPNPQPEQNPVEPNKAHKSSHRLARMIRDLLHS